MKKTKRTNYSQMSKVELDEIAERFDRSMVVDGSSPLTPRMKATDQRARRARPGRPRVGQGAEKIRISVERGLLNQADALAERTGMTRSELISRGLRAAILLAS